MTLTFVLALMTLAAIFAVLAPLARRRPALAVQGGGDVAVYRDQLAEIDRDLSRGAIRADEAEAARIEVSRRLLAAAEDAERQQVAGGGSAWRRRAVIVLAFLLVPLIGAGVYLRLGRPALPDQPLAARRAVPMDQQSLPELVARVESELAKRPDDGRGWEIIGPIYLRMERYEDAANAFRSAIRLNGSSAERQSSLGEALALAAGGVVTADAKAAFEAALKEDPATLRARFWLARAAEQDGRREAAADIYRAMLKEAPADAPWIGAVRQALAAVALGPEGAMPQVDAQAMAKATPQERMATIRAMVDGLEARLGTSPSDLGGWLRLMRARVMLGDEARARETLNAARAALGQDAAALRRIDDLALALGLNG